MFRLLSTDMRFFDLLDRAAMTLVEAAEAYALMVQSPKEGSHNYVRLREIEQRGDEILRETKQLLSQVFLTPIDREDIQALIYRLDDGIDEIDAAGISYIHEDQQEREMEYEPDYGND